MSNKDTNTPSTPSPTPTPPTPPTPPDQWADYLAWERENPSSPGGGPGQ